MNESYQEAALIEAKNLGEGTAEYYKNQQNILSGSFNAGVGIQPRMNAGTLRGNQAQDLMMFNNKQLLLNKT